MFKLRYIANRKFKFLGPVYSCYKVIEEKDQVWFLCYRWDYMKFEWFTDDDVRPILKIDLILQFIFILLVLFLISKL